MDQIELKASGIDFETARNMANEQAHGRDVEGELLSWFDRKESRYSPWVPPECACNSEEHPYWERYAIHRGGRLKVMINDGEYIFIYA